VGNEYKQVIHGAAGQGCWTFGARLSNLQITGENCEPAIHGSTLARAAMFMVTFGTTISMARPRAMRYRTGQATFMSTDRVAVRLLYDSLAMTACNNYWGTLDEAVIEQIIYDKGWIYSVHPLAGRSRSEYADSRQPASAVHAEHPCGSNPPFAHGKGRISGVSRRISLPIHSNSMTCVGPTRKPPLPHALGGAPPDDLI
jgi:hypothetical protein